MFLERGVENGKQVLNSGCLCVMQVLCMTVECGFGGQKFQEHVLDKVRWYHSCSQYSQQHILYRVMCIPRHVLASTQ